MALYTDERLTADETGVTIRMYYFPAGSKRVEYSEIRRFADLPMGKKNGQFRLWGSGDFRHWLYLDRDRREKTRRIVLDVGRRTRPVLTPDRPDKLVEILREQTGMEPLKPRADGTPRSRNCRGTTSTPRPAHHNPRRCRR